MSHNKIKNKPPKWEKKMGKTLSLCFWDSGTVKKTCSVPGDVSENVKLPANAAWISQSPCGLFTWRIKEMQLVGSNLARNPQTISCLEWKGKQAVWSTEATPGSRAAAAARHSGLVWNNIGTKLNADFGISNRSLDLEVFFQERNVWN